MIFSVVICTYQRAELLRTALESLCLQSLDESDFEVVIVDNNSADHTRLVSEKFVNNHSNIRYYLEKKQGHSYARNRGWQEARGAYVAYIDDECKVPADWLSIAKTIIDEHSPGLFGGPYFGYHGQQQPKWWKNEYGDFDEVMEAGSLVENGYITGGNLIVRRTLVEELDGFNTEFGMIGNKVGYGDETEFQQRLRTLKPNELIYYDPKLFLYHLVRPEKYSVLWLWKSRFKGATASYGVSSKSQKHSSKKSIGTLFFQALRISIRYLVRLIKNFAQPDREQHPFFQNYLYEEVGEYFHQLGLIYAQFRNRQQLFGSS